MAVYVDSMRAKYGRMIMCHMLADSDDELHSMADKIGVSRRWHQRGNTIYSHYDISIGMRAKAVRHGAVEISVKDAAQLIRGRRKYVKETGQ